MLDYIIRFIKRFAILLPGVAMAYLGAHEVYPYFRERIYAPLAILVTYVAVAYGLIPAALRLVRIVFRTNHIPHYCTTPDGFASDPVNIALVGSKPEVILAMEKVGWYLADKRSVTNVIKMALSIVLKRPYHRAPFSNLYLLGRRPDMGFERPLDENPLHRHHVRFWAVAETLDQRYKAHVAFWRKHHNVPEAKRTLWLGAASLDQGFGIIRHNAQFTHMIHHDTDAERELIAHQLKKAKLISRIKTVQLGEPYRLINRVWTGYLKTDGKMKIIDLK